MNKTRFRAVIVKEIRQILRDRLALAILFFVPVFLLVMFGYAISLDIRNIKYGVLDEDRSPASRMLLEAFSNSGYFDLVAVTGRAADFEGLMREEVLKMGLVIPRGFNADLSAGKPLAVQVLVDGANSNTATALLGYAQAIVGDFARRAPETFLPVDPSRGLAGAARPPAPLIDVRSRVWFNPEMKSSVYLVPGLIAIILIITAVISTALSVVREKERNTIEQLIVSPVQSVELIAGKLVPYFFIAAALTLFILGVSYVLFGVTVKGSFVLLGLVTALFLAGCLGLGLLISTIAETQQVAFLISTLATLLPSYILSGFVFPVRNMPPAIQAVTRLVPTRYFISGLRAIMLRGAGWEVVWPDLLFLAVFAALVFRASMLRLARSNIG